MNTFHIALPWIKPSSDPTAVSQIVAGTSKERHKFLPRSFASTAVQAWSYTLLHPPIFSTLHPFGVWRFPSICINAYNSGCGWTPAIWLVQLSLKILDSDHFYVIEKGLASAYINYCLSKQHIQGNGKKNMHWLLFFNTEIFQIFGCKICFQNTTTYKLTLQPYQQWLLHYFDKGTDAFVRVIKNTITEVYPVVIFKFLHLSPVLVLRIFCFVGTQTIFRWTEEQVCLCSHSLWTSSFCVAGRRSVFNSKWACLI